jgi:predicted PolB exonuclease-like 3'-5' exonuclease
MSEHSVIAWDLETVPDLRAVARMINMEGEADEKVRAALGSGFPKHPLHKIVCIGALVASQPASTFLIVESGMVYLRARPTAVISV